MADLKELMYLLQSQGAQVPQQPFAPYGSGVHVNANGYATSPMPQGGYSEDIANVPQYDTSPGPQSGMNFGIGAPMNTLAGMVAQSPNMAISQELAKPLPKRQRAKPQMSQLMGILAALGEIGAALGDKGHYRPGSVINPILQGVQGNMERQQQGFDDQYADAMNERQQKLQSLQFLAAQMDAAQKRGQQTADQNALWARQGQMARQNQDWDMEKLRYQQEQLNKRADEANKSKLTEREARSVNDRLNFLVKVAQTGGPNAQGALAEYNRIYGSLSQADIVAMTQYNAKDQNLLSQKAERDAMLPERLKSVATKRGLDEAQTAKIWEQVRLMPQEFQLKAFNARTARASIERKLSTPDGDPKEARLNATAKRLQMGQYLDATKTLFNIAKATKDSAGMDQYAQQMKDISLEIMKMTATPQDLAEAQRRVKAAISGVFPWESIVPPSPFNGPATINRPPMYGAINGGSTTIQPPHRRTAN